MFIRSHLKGPRAENGMRSLNDFVAKSLGGAVNLDRCHTGTCMQQVRHRF